MKQLLGIIFISLCIIMLCYVRTLKKRITKRDKQIEIAMNYNPIINIDNDDSLYINITSTLISKDQRINYWKNTSIYYKTLLDCKDYINNNKNYYYYTSVSSFDKKIDKLYHSGYFYEKNRETKSNEWRSNKLQELYDSWVDHMESILYIGCEDHYDSLIVERTVEFQEYQKNRFKLNPYRYKKNSYSSYNNYLNSH